MPKLSVKKNSGARHQPLGKQVGWSTVIRSCLAPLVRIGLTGLSLQLEDDETPKFRQQPRQKQRQAHRAGSDDEEEFVPSKIRYGRVYPRLMDRSLWAGV